MRIAIASDHGGFRFKSYLLQWLSAAGHAVIDCGTRNDESCDYPDYAILALEMMQRGEADRAILTCTNGIGMSMVANKFGDMRAALVYNEQTAADTRQHHDSNVLCLGQRDFTRDQLTNFVKIWLRTPFDGGERHCRRIRKFPTE